MISKKNFKIFVIFSLVVLPIFVFMNLASARTRGLAMNKTKQHQNRLIHEKSPYLLQHASNPVDWYPWGEEAFEKAKKEDKPIFLSIGYSTCHWCHVMAHESFEDEAIAQKINEYFVPIKVDREERPDIDNIYMSAVTAMTGRGGWPLTVILTPDKKPFFGGTYFPPKAKWGSSGLTEVMESIHRSWSTNREQLITSSNTLTEMIKENIPQGGGTKVLTKELLKSAFQQYDRIYDDQYGGFGSSPKFPSSHNLSYLLRYWLRTQDNRVLDMVKQTLVQMANGGMYDHLGGGFHRYSTDQYWQVPHFEKMLYDQAILARTYLEAYQITKEPFFAQVAREVLDYCLRDMKDDQGGFYSAEDADSLDPDEYSQVSVDPNQIHEKKEGAFYVWRSEEIDSILEKRAAQVFKYYFGIRDSGNAKNDPHQEFIGKNIVFVERTVKQTADQFKISEKEVNEILKESKDKLFVQRKTRPVPHLDDKILTDWNALLISSLAFASRVLDDEKYKDAAIQSADFLLATMIDKRGRLLHRYRDGDAGIAATIEDYAFLTNALIDLYEATFDLKYLKHSISLSDQMIQYFWDEERHGFYFTASDAKELIFRQKEIHDGAIPSGNSMAALTMVRLSHITLDKKWEGYTDKLIQAFSDELLQRPSAYAQMLIAFDYSLGPSQEIVIASTKNEDIHNFVNPIFNLFLPNKVVVLNSTKKDSKGIVEIAPFIENQKPKDDKTTVYVCENHVCKRPVTDVNALKDILSNLKLSL